MSEEGDIKAPLIIKAGRSARTKSILKWTEFFAYGTGHVFNDLCASLWFTYLLLFYHAVIELGNSYAGLLILIGQTADAISTPIIGMASDRTKFRYYGRRKIWHLIGTICVFFSFSFIWSKCYLCEIDHNTQSLAFEIVYYSFFIIIFQFGWASVQISHLSLIPELTSDESERVSLNSIRYLFTILSNISIFLVLAVVFGFTAGDGVTPRDIYSFRDIALGTVVVGVFFSIAFHIGVREPTAYCTPIEGKSQIQEEEEKPMTWYKWFTNPEFYLVALVYMCTRLVVNISQVYISLYLLDSLSLNKLSVAFAPLTIYVFGLIATSSMKYINKLLGRELTYFVGIGFVWAGLETFWVLQRGDYANLAYLGSAFLGLGGATILVTALSMTSDLIGSNTGTGAFVYGAMSFTDKLSNGVAIQIIQVIHPCKGEGSLACCSYCSPFYRYVLVSVPGVSSLVAYFGLCGLVLLRLYKQKKKRLHPIQ